MQYAELFAYFPVIPFTDKKGNHYLLRDYQPKDAQAVYDLFTHKKIKPYLPSSVIPADLEGAQREVQFRRDIFNRQISLNWVVADQQKEDRMIGTCSFESWSKFHRRLEIAYEMHPDYWRQGIMTEAILKSIQFGMDKMHANRIDAYTFANNAPSMSLLKKIGFTHEGTMKEYRMCQGKFHDIALFGLTKSQFKGRNSIIKQVRDKLKR